MLTAVANVERIYNNIADAMLILRWRLLLDTSKHRLSSFDSSAKRRILRR